MRYLIISAGERRFQNGVFPQALRGGGQELVRNPRKEETVRGGTSQDGPCSEGFLPLTSARYPCVAGVDKFGTVRSCGRCESTLWRLLRTRARRATCCGHDIGAGGISLDVHAKEAVHRLFLLRSAFLHEVPTYREDTSFGSLGKQTAQLGSSERPFPEVTVAAQALTLALTAARAINRTATAELSRAQIPAFGGGVGSQDTEMETNTRWV